MIAEALDTARRKTKKTSSPPASDVENVVTLIQFHDITRQHFERSSAACRAMLQRLSSPDREKSETSAAAEELARFCFCQMREIEETRETFIAAVARLIRKTGDIVDEIRRTSGNGAAAEIEPAVQGICVHKFVNIVSQEVLSNLDGIVEDVRPFIPAEAWREIEAESGPVSASDGTARPSGKEKDVSPEAENSLGDNVELF